MERVCFTGQTPEGLLITVDDGGAEDEGSWSWSRKRTEWDDDVSSLAVIISHVQRK